MRSGPRRSRPAARRALLWTPRARRSRGARAYSARHTPLGLGRARDARLFVEAQDANRMKASSWPCSRTSCARRSTLSSAMPAAARGHVVRGEGGARPRDARAQTRAGWPKSSRTCSTSPASCPASPPQRAGRPPASGHRQRRRHRASVRRRQGRAPDRFSPIRASGPSPPAIPIACSSRVEPAHQRRQVHRPRRPGPGSGCVHSSASTRRSRSSSATPARHRCELPALRVRPLRQPTPASTRKAGGLGFGWRSSATSRDARRHRRGGQRRPRERRDFRVGR